MANLFQRLASALRPSSAARVEPSFEAKASAAGVAISASYVGQPVWPTRDFRHFSEDGYMRNSISFRCIEIIAQSGASVNIDLFDKKGKKEIEDHPLLDLLRRPSPMTTGIELTERVFTFVKIAGNAYLEQVGPSRKGAPPKELYSLRPDCMKVIAGQSAMPAAYEYEVNGRKVRWDVDPITGQSQILHLKLFHPLDDWYGMSSMEPAAYSIDRHNEGSNHNMSVLQNGAVPSGALAFKPVQYEGQVVNAPPEIIAAAEKRLAERHQGSRNSGRPLVLGGNVDWLTFGQTMEQLQLIESMDAAARDICTAMGVPHILIVPGQSTYNNNREAKLALYEETVLPMLGWYLDHLNNWLVPLFGDNLELRADYDSIDALSIRREEKRKTYVELFDKRLANRTEVREALGFDDEKELPDYESQAHEVNAVISLITGGKLSTETGFGQLQKWGVLPEDMDPADEADKVTQEQGEVDGNTGLIEDPITGEPLDPATGKPKPPAPKPPVAKN